MALAAGKVDLPPSCAEALSVKSKQEMARDFKSLKMTVSKNAFTVGRRLGEYEHTFGGWFKERLEIFGPNHRWLDAGAGEALAMAGFLKRYWSDNQQRTTPELVAVAVSRPPLFDFEHFLGAQFEYLDGRYIENIPDEELGSYDIITDFYGPLSYTTEFSLVLEKYLRLLKPGGQIFLAGRFSQPDDEGQTQMTIYLQQYKKQSLIAWLRSLPEIDVTMVNSGREGNHEAYIISRVTAKPPTIPHLELLYLESGSPPVRIFNLK